ncbi:unnamed protein product [Larinioides sclopetarius]|uniref:Secreted protein n=1 Tax=Larinioides sclopetarius TaxID=280406 RepID=A0AAV2BXR2_9ARAC
MQNICVEWLFYIQAAKIMYLLQLLTTFCTDGCSVLSRMDADSLILLADNAECLEVATVLQCHVLP